MRILLSNFLEDQFERVVGALDEERKASLAAEDSDLFAQHLESSGGGSTNSSAVETAQLGTRKQGGFHGKHPETTIESDADVNNHELDPQRVPDTGIDPGECTAWPPPPISEPSVLNGEVADLTLECNVALEEEDLAPPYEEAEFNTVFQYDLQAPRLLQVIDLDRQGEHGDEGDETGSLSNASVKTRSGMIQIQSFKGTRCLGIDHLFGKSVEVASYEDTTHLVDVLSTMQKVLGVPMVAVSSLTDNMVYLKTPGGVYMEKNPVLGSFLDWISAIASYHVALEDDVTGPGTCDQKKPAEGASNTLPDPKYDEQQTDDHETNCDGAGGSNDMVWRVESTVDHPVFSKCMYCKHSPYVRYVCTVPIYAKENPGIMIGHAHAMGRAPCNDQFMTAFASVLSMYLKRDEELDEGGGEGENHQGGEQGSRKAHQDSKCIDQGRKRAEALEGPLDVMKAHRARRHDMLVALFDDWHLPLEIVHGDRTLYSNRQFRDFLPPIALEKEGIPAEYNAAASSVPLFGYEFVENDPIRATVQLCSMLLLCAPGFDAREEVGPYTLRYLDQATSIGSLDQLVRSIEGVTNIEPTKPRSYWCSCCDMYKGYTCLHHGKPAMVEAVRYQVAKGDALAAYGRSWVDTMKRTGELFHHHNILKNSGCGVFGPESCPQGNWIIQQATMMPLSEAIRTHFTGMLKPLYVALSALDVAYAIQHVHNVGLVYEDLDSSRIFLQEDPKEAIRGWKIVLSLPDMLDTVSTRGKITEHNLVAMCPHRSRRSCPEKSLGCRRSLRSESFEFGVLLWEMWEGLPIWPQVDREEDLLNVICYERHVLGCCSLMPMPLRTIFQRCIGHWGHPAISNETIITMLQDWISKLMRNASECRRLSSRFG